MPAPMIGIDNTNVTKFKIPDNKLLNPITPEPEEENRRPGVLSSLLHPLLLSLFTPYLFPTMYVS
jgi:hypothetical protein